MAAIVQALIDVLGEQGVVHGEDVRARAEGWASAESCKALAVVRPSSTHEVSTVLALCHRNKVEVVPYGGGTGLVRGAIAAPGQILLSLDRMQKIESLSAVDRTAVVEAGVTLHALQQAADSADLFFPLDLGARGSATIGGNIATNAGGNRVVRFGMMREMVLGLEAVLPDGSVLSSMNRMIKNNSGYDLKQLLIGSEGTLGVVTRAVLRLREKCPDKSVALISVRTFSDVIHAFRHLDRWLGGSLSAFEVMWREFYDTVTGARAGRPPLPAGAPYYILVESVGGGTAPEQSFETVLAALASEGRIVDAVIAASQAQCDTIWGIRDDVEALMSHGPVFMFDVSLPISRMEAYVGEIRSKLDARWPDNACIVWGHIGDCNLHVWIFVQSDSVAVHAAVSEIVYAPLAEYDGSISAEHGIGEEKRDYLGYTRSAVEIDMMRRLKTVFDPDNIMNPGKILPRGAGAA
ncbi:FAD-binding oxidoreductase [Sphingosinicella soli]|uniref:FAD/FMN-containing dehydrogenase n=1 Tax=Sphingosinicella soli TaxID=333708 RepID=A0A7W7B4B3_9SPHN|nr:FAD-binding oxidoreductase [Sphingosinicella soli]MBB4632657.1 FAD/FMN-containing dehydrogenase [Sphingosinicella soli]